MQYRFINIYEIRGLNHPSGKGDITLYTKEGIPFVRAILTDKPDGYCYEIDRAKSLGYLMSRGFAGQSASNEPQPELERHIIRIRENRKKQLGTSEALVFIAEGEVEADLSGPSVDRGDYTLGFDVVSKEQITETLSTEVNAILAGLCLSAENDSLQLRRLDGDVYLVGESGKPMYSLGISISGKAYSSRQTTDEVVEKTRKHFSSLAIDSSLSRVYKLYIQGVSRENDELRRFMFSWSALEILINKVFSEYEKLFIQNLLGADPVNNAQRYFDRVRDVMKEKYRIMDKFIVIAACIGKDSVEADIEEFGKIKKIRDTLLHGEIMDEKSLPVAETVRLLWKYMRCHLDAKAV